MNVERTTDFYNKLIKPVPTDPNGKRTDFSHLIKSQNQPKIPQPMPGTLKDPKRTDFSRRPPIPIVVLHGLLDSCQRLNKDWNVVGILKYKLPNVYVRSLCIGKTKLTDLMRGIIDSLDRQVSKICELLSQDPNLARGFNAIGLSQVNIHFEYPLN